jgi:hypothetical protein
MLGSGDDVVGATVIDSSAAGLLDGNGRAARLARWLRDKPVAAGVDLLALDVKTEDGFERAQSWPKNSVSMALATIIDALVQDMANESGQYLSARVLWWDSEKSIAWATFPLRVHPENMGAQQAYSGEPANVTIQLQSRLDRATALHLGSISEVFQTVKESNEDTRERARRAEREADDLRAKYAESERARIDLERRVGELEDDLAAAMELAEEQTTKVAEAKKEAEETGGLMKLVGPALGLTPAKAG